MHKSLWLGFFVFLILLSPVLGQTQLASDGFETGTFTGGTGWINGGWVNTGSVAILGWTSPYEGNRHVWLRSSGASMTRSVSTTSTDGVTISFASKFKGLNGGTNARLLVNDVIVKQWVAADTHEDWRVYSFNVSNVGDSAVIRFEGNMNNLGQEFHIDDIKIHSLEGGSPDPGNETPGVLYEAGNSYYIEKLENGAFRLVVGDAITYYDGTDYLPVWRNIYNLSQYEFEDYNLGVETLKYNAYFKRTGGNVQLVSFVSNNTRVIYQPQVIGWINIWDGRENIAMPQTSNGVVGDSRITYENLYGEGIDLSYRAYGNYLRKEIIVENKSNLVPPSEFALSQGPVVFYAEYLLSITNIDRIVVDGVDWSFTGSVTTNNSIELINDANGVLFKIKEPFVLDANNQRFNASYQLFEESGSLRIRIIVPYETLWEDAVYPIIIDPTTGYDEQSIEQISLEFNDETLDPIKKITLYNVSGEGQILLDNNVTTQEQFQTSYAMNPEGLTFSYGELEVKEAKGELLLKCVDWNFETQQCGECLEYEEEICVVRDETWIHAQELTVGQNYTFMFDAVDPGYGEYSLSSGESSTTSTSFVNKLSHTFTPMLSGHYLIMGTGGLTGSSTAHTVSSRLTLDGAVVSEHNHEPTNTDRARDYQSFSGFMVKYLEKDEDYVINIDYSAGGGGTVAYIKNAAVATAVMQPGNHHYINSTASQTVIPAQTVYATLNFTAQQTGEYVILGSGESYNGYTTGQQQVYLYQAGTLLDSSSYYAKDPNDYTSFGYYKTVNLTENETYNFTIQASRTDANNGNLRNLYLIAFPAMREDLDYVFAESDATSSTSTTSATKVTFTFTPNYPGTYYVFGSSQISHTNAGRSPIVDMRINGTSVCNVIKQPQNTGDWYPVNCLYAYNFTNTSYTIDMIYRSSNTGGTANIRNARIGVWSISDVFINPDPCAYPGVGAWRFIDNRYCHIIAAVTGDGSNIYMLSSNTTRFSANIVGFINLSITNSSTITIDNSSTVRLGT